MKVFLYCHILFICPLLCAMEENTIEKLKTTQSTIYQSFHDIEHTILTKLQDIRPHLKAYKELINAAQNIPATELEKHKKEIHLLEKFEKKFIDTFGDDDFDTTSDKEEEQEASSPISIHASSSPIAIPKRTSSSDLISLQECIEIKKNKYKTHSQLHSFKLLSVASLGKYHHQPKSRSSNIRPKSCPPTNDLHDIDLQGE